MLDKDNRLSEEAMNRTIETSDVAPLANRSIGDTAPTIRGFFPQSGRPGDLITITGANLGSVTSVTFNGVPTSDFTTAPTILKAIVPSRATTGPIQVSGPTDEATSFGSFTVMQGAPSIIDIVPSSGPPGTAVTILGTHLEGTNRVTFNSVDASSFSVRSPEQVQATAPEVVGIGSIQVYTPERVVRSPFPFTVTAARDVNAPTVRVLSPNGGERFQPGQQVMIQWQSSDNVGVVAHNVQFSPDGGGTFSDIVINLPGSAQSFPWTVPNRPTTQGVIQVVARDAAGNQSSDRSDSVFTIAISPSSAPTIASFSPMSGLPGTRVTITGANFSVADPVDLSVLFNVTDAVVNSASATSIVATVPLGATTGVLKVGTPAGTATGTSPFTVTTPPPAISSFSPLSGQPGDLVSITGTGFAEIDIVKFNGVQTLFTRDADTSITTRVPSGATTGRIQMFSQTRTVLSPENFIVQNALPIISGFSPTSGGVNDIVRISGTNLNSVTSVSFNGVNAPFSYDSEDFYLIATVPLGAPSGPISVSGPGGLARSTTNFTVSKDVAIPSVRVTTPNGGERFQPGQQVVIQWQSSDNVGVVFHNIQFSADGGDTFIDIAINLAGSIQSFPWTVPNRPTRQGMIQVVARDAAGNRGMAKSNAPFTIEAARDTLPPIIEVRSPTGGDILQAGQSFVITWQSSDNAAVVAHDLLFSATNEGPSEPIATGLPGTQQSFSWTIPNRPTTEGVIWVVARDAAGNEARGRSNGLLVIRTATEGGVPTGASPEKQSITIAAGDSATFQDRAALFSGGQPVVGCIPVAIKRAEFPAPPLPEGMTVTLRPVLEECIDDRPEPNEIDRIRVRNCRSGEQGDCGKYTVTIDTTRNTPPGSYNFIVFLGVFTLIEIALTVTLPAKVTLSLESAKKQEVVAGGDPATYRLKVQRSFYTGPITIQIPNLDRIVPGAVFDVQPDGITIGATDKPDAVHNVDVRIGTTKPVPGEKGTPPSEDGPYTIPIIASFPKAVEVNTLEVKLDVKLQPRVGITVIPDLLKVARGRTAIYRVRQFRYNFMGEIKQSVSGQPAAATEPRFTLNTQEDIAPQIRREIYELEIDVPPETEPKKYPLTIEAQYTRNGKLQTESAKTVLRVQPDRDEKIVLAAIENPQAAAIGRCAEFIVEVSAPNFQQAVTVNLEAINLKGVSLPRIDPPQLKFDVGEGPKTTKIVLNLLNPSPEYLFDINATTTLDKEVISGTLLASFGVSPPKVIMNYVNNTPDAKEKKIAAGQEAMFGIVLDRGGSCGGQQFDGAVTLSVDKDTSPEPPTPKDPIKATIRQPGPLTPGMLTVRTDASLLPGLYSLRVTGEAEGAGVVALTLSGDEALEFVVEITSETEVTVISPAENQKNQGCQNLMVTWTTKGPVSFHDVELEVNGFAVRLPGSTDLPATQRNYLIKLPNPSADLADAVIRVVAKDSSKRPVDTGEVKFQVRRTIPPSEVDLKLMPTSGSAGTTVAITAVDRGDPMRTVGVFAPDATAVFFGTALADSIFVLRSEAVIAGVPRNLPGGQAVDVSVETCAGRALLPDAFVLDPDPGPQPPPVPTITGFSPGSGPIGTTVILTGTGLADATGVSFNGVKSSVSVASPTSITTTVPPGATTGSISVTTAQGSAASASPFTVMRPVSKVDLSASPSTQSITAGQSASYAINISPSNVTGGVTLSVSGLPTGATAAFNPNPATGTSVVLTVTTAANTPGGSYNLTLSGSALDATVTPAAMSLTVTALSSVVSTK